MYDGDSWMWHGGGSGWWILMAVLTVVFWAVVITVVVLAIRYVASDRGRSAAPTSAQAEDLLAERYARGEVDDDEYRQRLALLREHR
ncbi:MAG: SHOCT domain-containing protein [Mycobacterium sp.]|nr:SHOCT domain-containing protein [Mycobacterium sp.]